MGLIRRAYLELNGKRSNEQTLGVARTAYEPNLIFHLTQLAQMTSGSSMHKRFAMSKQRSLSSQNTWFF